MTHTWNVMIHLFDADDLRADGVLTRAHAVLHTSAGTTLEGRGSARRAARDRNVPEIGEELAAARALRDLADRLLRVTSDDVSALVDTPVELHH